MLAVIRFKHHTMTEAELAGLLQECFSTDLSASNAILRSERFKAGQAAMPPILHACGPSSDSVAIFFRLNDTLFECNLESIPERSETIYEECDYVISEVFHRLSATNRRPELAGLSLEDEKGNRLDITAHFPSFFECFRERLERAGWVTQIIYLAFLLGIAFKFTDLLTTVYIGLIGLASAAIASALQAWWDTRCRKLKWRVG